METILLVMAFNQDLSLIMTLSPLAKVFSTKDARINKANNCGWHGRPQKVRPLSGTITQIVLVVLVLLLLISFFFHMGP